MVEGGDGDRLRSDDAGIAELRRVQRRKPPVAVAEDELIAGRVVGKGADAGRLDDGGGARGSRGRSSGSPCRSSRGAARRCDRRANRVGPPGSTAAARTGTPRSLVARTRRHPTGPGRWPSRTWPGAGASIRRCRASMAVAPVLQELRCGPCVVDLVEVHLVRLREAERAQDEAGQDEHHDQPQIEPVEAATALASEQPASIRPDRRRVEARPEPADDAQLGERGARPPGRQRDGR